MPAAKRLLSRHVNKVWDAVAELAEIVGDAAPPGAMSSSTWNPSCIVRAIEVCCISGSGSRSKHILVPVHLFQVRAAHVSITGCSEGFLESPKLCRLYA